ncbi:hypothetical protein H0E87_006164 [Populus deltoides]|uniref:Trafficking protein particle complex subunit 2 n=1 Tax=Populus deltoides TaxID=3696 RepID=A0A8T2Z619_POPDE|nr:hypothetical protein H0E87_006164 [Populus deltoides]
MATTACFIIVSRNDIPIYEAEVGSATKREDAAQMHQFILHAALDIVQDLAWTTSAMYLKAIDRFNDMVVSVYVTAGHILCICDFVCYSNEKWFMLCILPYLLVYIILDLSYIRDLCYFMTLAMMMESRAFSRRFMSCRWRPIDQCVINSADLPTSSSRADSLILLNPLYLPGSRITSSHFDTKVRALARKYL